MSNSIRTALAAVGFVLAAAELHAQAAATIPEADRPRYIRVYAKDYAFDAPATSFAGVATIHLINQGSDLHHLTVQELPEGRTVREYLDAVQRTGLPPAWSKSIGQTAMIPNGGEAFIAFRMPPGRYVLSCVIPAADGRSHVAKGMYQLITATRAPAPAATPRTAPAPNSPAAARPTATPRPATPRP